MKLFKKYGFLIFALLALYFLWRAMVNAEHRTIYISMIVIYLLCGAGLYFASRSYHNRKTDI